MFFLVDNCSPVQVGEQGKVSLVSNFFALISQVTSDHQGREALFQTEELSPSTSSTPPISPSSASESPISPTSPTDEATPTTETSSVKSRQKRGRPRPRPISDYGQLLSRKHSIPEEVGELLSEERSANPLQRKDGTGNDAYMNGESPESCSMNGDIQARRQRPISVIGPVDLFPPDAELKEDNLPSVSFYRFYTFCAKVLKL